MKVLILGGNGYLGQATAACLRARGHTVVSIDSNVKHDEWMPKCGVYPLFGPDDPPFFQQSAASRVAISTIEAVDAVVHYAEQASAPFSMRSDADAFTTLWANVGTTYDLIQRVRRENPECHIVKLGTMGEWGTPGVDIPDGWYLHEDIEGSLEAGNAIRVVRSARLPFPKQPGSFYHCTKVMDSDMLYFAARVWGLRVTDLNQGVVYGCTTDELPQTRFYYDHIFGTCLNRFVTQAVAGMPLTVYGRGGQTRGWLNIRDTLRCVELALESPPPLGEFRVLNQFTETFSVRELAERVARVHGSANVSQIENPRIEQEEHYYHASNEGFRKLGLEPHLLTDDVIAEMIQIVGQHADNIDTKAILPKVTWR